MLSPGLLFETFILSSPNNTAARVPGGLKHMNNFLGRGAINMPSCQYIMHSKQFKYNIAQEYVFKGSLKCLAVSELLCTGMEKGINSSLI